MNKYIYIKCVDIKDLPLPRHYSVNLNGIYKIHDMDRVGLWYVFTVDGQYTGNFNPGRFVFLLSDQQDVMRMIYD